MPEPTPHFREVFLDVYEELPRQGPGNRDCAARALALCGELPSTPAILDLGCGNGGQALHLAALTDGVIDALDNHAPFIAQLTREAATRGLTHRIRPVVSNMGRPPFPPGSFDLIWSEGALYQIGVEHALSLLRPHLKPHGYLAFTEAVWRRDDPPAEVRAFWDREYSQIDGIAANLALIARAGFDVCGHFTLPDAAWWDDYYTPIEQRIAALRPKYAGDDEALAIFDSILAEGELHRRYSAYYGYEFFVLRRLD